MFFLLNLLLTATAITFILPQLEGISLAGTFFGSAMSIALLLTGSTWFVKQVARAFALSLGLTTMVPGLLVLIPLAVVGMWLLPASEMLFLSKMGFGLHVQDWASALLAGLVLLFINVVTHKWSDTLRKPCDCQNKKW